jgi:hypothetical protein
MVCFHAPAQGGQTGGEWQQSPGWDKGACLGSILPARAGRAEELLLRMPWLPGPRMLLSFLTKGASKAEPVWRRARSSLLSDLVGVQQAAQGLWGQVCRVSNCFWGGGWRSLQVSRFGSWFHLSSQPDRTQTSLAERVALLLGQGLSSLLHYSLSRGQVQWKKSSWCCMVFTFQEPQAEHGIEGILQ